MIVYNGRGGDMMLGILGLIFLPIITRLSRILCGAIGCFGKEFAAAFISFAKEVVLLVGVVSHPSWVVPAESAIIRSEIGKIIVVQGIRVSKPSLILSLCTHRFFVGWTT